MILPGKTKHPYSQPPAIVRESKAGETREGIGCKAKRVVSDQACPVFGKISSHSISDLTTKSEREA
jgi:hypothetical protein